MDKCIANDVFPATIDLQLKQYKKAWQNRELDYDDYLYEASKLYTKCIANKEIIDIEFVAKKVIEKKVKDFIVSLEIKLNGIKFKGIRLFLFLIILTF